MNRLDLDIPKNVKLNIVCIIHYSYITLQYVAKNFFLIKINRTV